MMRICSIASSSSGNCIYVGSRDTHILIDSGISGKRLKAGLDMIGVNPESIDGILVTHEHSDHIKGLGVVSRKYRIPIYTSELTWEKITTSGLTGIIDNNLFNKISPDRDFMIKDLVIHPFSISHDAVHPLCYTVRKDNKKISIATDLGCYDSYITEKLKDSNVLFIEANHDVEMLQKGDYPYYLKKRILSDKGHLSNIASGKLISELLNGNLQYIILGHLSRENNHPDTAHKSVRAELAASDKICLHDIQLIVSEREEITGMVTI